MRHPGADAPAEQHVSPGAVAAHYDRLDAFYREVWGAHVHHGLWLHRNDSHEQAKANLAKVVVDKLQAGRSSAVCDIGCGYGEAARWMAESLQCNVTGITVSAAQYDFAKSFISGATNPAFVLGDWLTNDLPEGSFDAAIAIESSEHISTLSGFFGQARRILRVGGRLVVSAWLRADNVVPWQRRWLLHPISLESHLSDFRCASEYQTCALNAGFANEEFSDVSSDVVRTWSSVSRAFALSATRDPKRLRFLLGRHSANRQFAWTILRIAMAYRLGALRYCIFSWTAV